MLDKSFRGLVAIAILAIGAVADGAEFRTWTDATGQFSLTAKFNSTDGGPGHPRS